MASRLSNRGGVRKARCRGSNGEMARNDWKTYSDSYADEDGLFDPLDVVKTRLQVGLSAVMHMLACC